MIFRKPKLTADLKNDKTYPNKLRGTTGTAHIHVDDEVEELLTNSMTDRKSKGKYHILYDE